MTTRELPMFPLGLVLVPGAVLPLHIFEPRYRALVHDVLAADADFGVVLIERGSESGGGETRANVGTIAHIADGHAFEDGRYALACFGTERISIAAWLPDDPYPRALIEPWPDPPAGPCIELLAAVETQLRALSGWRTRFGLETADIDLADDPTVASYQAITLADLGPFDAQQALACPDVPARLELLTRQIADAVTLLELQADGL